MSSLLRSPSIRRALSAASPGGLRAPSAVAAAIGGEGGATIRRGLGLPTVPRRHLCAPQQNRHLTATAVDQCDALYEEVRATKVSLLEKDLLLHIIESSWNACCEFAQKDKWRTRMICAATLGGFFAGSWMRTRKMDNERELRNEDQPGNGADENLLE
ncbi:uncharacterized protein LOC124686491 [Lolium rigidum]|uniref:uncharacterized protein LOC124686491 n=1 Tax=Lolium rigidum TaxID=89674 RepID=UPI001F5CAED0|nr:uncharacterized protein LOC124686491 [Lolium rigidum]